MQKYFNILVGTILVALLCVVGAPLVRSLSFGGPNYEAIPKWYGNGLYAGLLQQFSVSNAGAVTVGSAGTLLSGFNFGTCTITAYSNTIAASSSATADCAATGIVSGDNVEITQSTTSPTVAGGLVVLASASSTSGYITLKIINDTGGTFTWSAVASTTYFSYRAFR
jgi:hypothetical protein